MSEKLLMGEDTKNDYKSCDKARAAFRAGDVEASRREHMKPMDHHEHHTTTGDYVKSVVFGGLDGVTTTFAIIAAAAGSNSDFITVLIFGISNVIADGFSMGFGEYVSGKAELESAIAERRREEWEVENCFDLEVDEMVHIYMSKGLSFDDASTIVEIISKDHKMFVDFMMVDELGILVDLEDTHAPKRQALAMLLSFWFFGFVPLLAYLPGKGKGLDGVFLTSCALSLLSLLGLGLFKGYLIGVNKARAALEMAFMGFVGGLVSFSVGNLIESALR